MARLEYSDYHTAVANRTGRHNNDSFGDDERLTAFVHDVVSEPFDDRFLQADFIYIQPPWPKGYASFNGDGDYREFTDSCVELINTLEIPAFAILGKSFYKSWEPHRTSDIDYVFHGGYESVLGVWFWDGEIDFASELDAAEVAIRECSCILDFCCGYGNTARWALESGKKVICSDSDPSCIAFILGR